MELDDLQALMKMREDRDGWKNLASAYVAVILLQCAVILILLAIVRGVLCGH